MERNISLCRFGWTSLFFLLLLGTNHADEGKQITLLTFAWQGQAEKLKK